MKSKGVNVAILVMYGDDIVVNGNDDEKINKLKEHMKSKFKIKDIGALRSFLGIEVARSNKRIAISQRK